MVKLKATWGFGDFVWLHLGHILVAVVRGGRVGGALLGGTAGIVGRVLPYEGDGVGAVEPVRAVEHWGFRLRGVRAVEL